MSEKLPPETEIFLLRAKLKVVEDQRSEALNREANARTDLTISKNQIDSLKKELEEIKLKNEIIEEKE